MSADMRMTAEWTGHQVIDTAGDKIGTVQDVRYDEGADRPQWLVVKTGLFGTKKVLVPASDARMDGDRIRVPYTEDRVKDAPQVMDTDSLSRDEQQELSLYYGLEVPEPVMGESRPTTLGDDMSISRGPEMPSRDRETTGTGGRQK